MIKDGPKLGQILGDLDLMLYTKREVQNDNHRNNSITAPGSEMLKSYTHQNPSNLKSKSKLYTSGQLILIHPYAKINLCTSLKLTRKKPQNKSN